MRHLFFFYPYPFYFVWHLNGSFNNVEQGHLKGHGVIVPFPNNGRPTQPLTFRLCKANKTRLNATGACSDLDPLKVIWFTDWDSWGHKQIARAAATSIKTNHESDLVSGLKVSRLIICFVKMISNCCRVMTARPWIWKRHKNLRQTDNKTCHRLAVQVCQCTYLWLHSWSNTTQTDATTHDHWCIFQLIFKLISYTKLFKL